MYLCRGFIKYNMRFIFSLILIFGCEIPTKNLNLIKYCNSNDTLFYFAKSKLISDGDI